MGSNWAGAIRKKKMRRTRKEQKRLMSKECCSDTKSCNTEKKA